MLGEWRKRGDSLRSTGVDQKGYTYRFSGQVLQPFYLSNMSGKFALVVASPSLDQSGGVHG